MAAQQAPVATVTLAEALRRSQIVAPSIVSAEGAIRTSQLSSRTALWNMIPALTITPRADLQFANGQSRLDPVTGQVTSTGENTTVPSVQLGLNATYTIFDGFGRNYTLKQRRAQEAGADASLTVAKFNSDFATTQAFFSALASRQQLAVSQSNLDAAQGQLTLASAKLRAGSATLSDSLAALGSFLQARLGLLTAQNNLIVNETNLGRLIGVSGRVAATDDSAFYRPAAALDTASIRQEAMTVAPVIRNAEASLLASQQAYRATKATYLPTLAATANSNWTAAKPGYAVVPRRSLGLTLQWSPWTSYARETQVENAAITITNNEATLADARNGISAQINQAFAALSTAGETINVSAAARAAGEENLRVVTERYRTGVATITEVLAAQQQLVTAQTNQLTARYTYLNAKAQLEQVLGRKL
ncbi:MAG: TolC family protein [Gemmatimonadota bacterium]